MDTFINCREFKDRESKRIQLWTCYAKGRIFHAEYVTLPAGTPKIVKFKKEEV